MLCLHSLQRKQAELRKIEEEMQAKEKHRRQQEVRNMYDESVELKNQKRAREEQEELAFDMKILEQVLKESMNEAKEMSLRKVCSLVYFVDFALLVPIAIYMCKVVSFDWRDGRWEASSPVKAQCHLCSIWALTTRAEECNIWRLQLLKMTYIIASYIWVT